MRRAKLRSTAGRHLLEQWLGSGKALSLHQQARQIVLGLQSVRRGTQANPSKIYNRARVARHPDATMDATPRVRAPWEPYTWAWRARVYTAVRVRLHAARVDTAVRTCTSAARGELNFYKKNYLLVGTTCTHHVGQRCLTSCVHVMSTKDSTFLFF